MDHNIFNITGMSNSCMDQDFYSVKLINASFNQNLKDQFLQKWYSDINNFSKQLVTEFFKTSFVCEKYSNTLSRKFRNIRVKFRTSNHRLPIDVSR